jgi:hypothetical protein
MKPMCDESNCSSSISANPELNPKLTCKICGKICKNYLGVSSHTRQAHNISSKEYYDKFFKKDEEGLCKECGKETSFKDINIGYKRFCSIQCGVKSKETKIKKINTNLYKHGVKNPMQNKEIQEKHATGVFKNYGVLNPRQNKEICKKAQQTCIEKFGATSPSGNKEIREKQKQTCMENYGVLNPSQSNIIKERKKETCMKNWGAECFFSSKEYRKRGEESGKFIPLNQLSEYQLYRRLVDIETRKHLKELYNKWDGLDYYTGEKLITKKELKQLYPYNKPKDHPLCASHDHKLSVQYCFLNNLSIKDCSSINNLCICSWYNNVSKNYKIDSDFIKELNIINTNEQHN